MVIAWDTTMWDWQADLGEGGQGHLNSLVPEPNGGKITDDKFKRNFINKNWLIFIFYSLKSVSWYVIDESIIGLDNGLTHNRQQAII